MSYLPGLEPPTPEADAHDGAGDEWYTPPDVWRAVSLALGPGIVDPCHAPGSPVDAPHRIDIRSGGDGLRDSWGPIERPAFCNPPYSDTSAWLARCAEEYRNGRDVIALVPMRPETRAWHAYVWPAATVVQTLGRLRFVGRDGQQHGSGMITTCFVCWSNNDKHPERRALALTLQAMLQQPSVVVGAL